MNNISLNTPSSTPPTQETKNFSADVARLLEIVAHALYSNRDVFLRELIANAADACDRARYEALTKPDLLDGQTEFKIRILKDSTARTITVIDNGIGMTRDDMSDHLGTIAKSGTKAIMDQLKQSGSKADMSLIGQFGVGFYSLFMVATKATVVSQKIGLKDCSVWESDGATGYNLRHATQQETDLVGPRGTAVIIHLKDDASDYLVDAKLEQIITKWSDHITLPVYLNDLFEKPVNAASALWMRGKSTITSDQYREFFTALSYGFAGDEPMITSHFKAEGKIEYSALLFVPTLRPWDLYDPTRKHNVRLYVKRIFITDQCEGLIYPWLRFIRGVIDSEDLPLNISREMLQRNPLIEKIRSGITKRILTDLIKLADDDAEKYGAFWAQFGAVIKEGLYDAADHRDDLLKLCRFASSNGDQMTTLEAYVSRMKEGQDKIFFMTGPNQQTLMNSPQLEGFKARGIEVLLMTDTIDDFWLQSVPDYAGKVFQSITKGAVDLGKFKADQTTQPDIKPDTLAPILLKLKDILKDEVGDVRLSDRLTDSAVCLVAGENEVDMQMDKILRASQNYNSSAKRILEINPSHPLIQALEKIADSDLPDTVFLLLDQARIIQGEPVKDPSAFARRMSAFLARSLAA